MEETPFAIRIRPHANLCQSSPPTTPCPGSPYLVVWEGGPFWAFSRTKSPGQSLEVSWGCVAALVAKWTRTKPRLVTCPTFTKVELVCLSMFINPSLFGFLLQEPFKKKQGANEKTGFQEPGAWSASSSRSALNSLSFKSWHCNEAGIRRARVWGDSNLAPCPTFQLTQGASNGFSVPPVSLLDPSVAFFWRGGAAYPWNSWIQGR